MEHLDTYFLSLQFKIQIYSKNGTEFQSFFETIMEKAFSDFQKIRPYGKKGDGGNDGYRKESGIYYQSYAPNTPKVNEADAAEKLEKDFQKLKKEWSGISEIREYNFVFNDKYGGSTQELEATISELATNNPNIKFKLLLAKNLENIFFQLSQTDILSLGFNIDQRKAILNVNIYLEKVRTELDRENINFALKTLENIKDIILALSDDNYLLLEYEILETQCIRKLEKVDEAKERYEKIANRYTNDIRSLLYLAEIYLLVEDFDKNNELLQQAEKIDPNSWLLELEKIIRKVYLKENLDITKIDETSFPNDPKIKANFYRIYAGILSNSGEIAKADNFIAKAIYLHSDKFSNYYDELALIENKLFTAQSSVDALQISQELINKVQKIENRFFEYGDIGARNKASLNAKKFRPLIIQENISEFERLAKETFELLMICYFDKRIDVILVLMLGYVLLSNHDFNRLLKYIENSKKECSNILSKELIAQFNMRGTLFTAGKKFFEATHNQKYIEFIEDLENRNDEKILTSLRSDLQFAVLLCNTLKTLPDLRIKIIKNLPDDVNIQKDKLELLLNYDERNWEEAFEIVKQLDLSALNYGECRPILQIAAQKQAWDFVITILEKLLEKEKNEKEVFDLKLQLFAAYFNLKKFQTVINIGEELLQEDIGKNFLDLNNKEALLTNTIIACLERGKVDDEALTKSKYILEKYKLPKLSLEFKASIEARVYLDNNEPENALNSIIDGVKTRKTLSPQEYAGLHPLFIEIGNQLTTLNLDSLSHVQENSFVKLSNVDQWYFIGSDNELDAVTINESNSKYSSFFNKNLEDIVIFESKYSSAKREDKIDFIFSIDKYILWQTIENFRELSLQGDLEWAQMVEIPQDEDSIDTQYLLKLLEDLHKRGEPFFEVYCKGNVPLAMLAVSEGGLTKAIERIRVENKGFINFSSGSIDDMKKQLELAKEIVDGKEPFYIDGTSAMVLLDIGLFQKVYAHLPNMKIPQSVINFLADTTDKFRYKAGQTGHLGYSQGKIAFSSIEKDKRDLIRKQFIETIKLLESNSENISVISSANKTTHFSEQKIPSELSDACILAQKENLSVLTEDFLYLQLNEFETHKKAPKHFAVWALLRTLCDEHKIGFDEYLECFSYLSYYRFRFLHINKDDIEKAVFGDKQINIPTPENIRKLNFRTTLSEEYGVSFQEAFRVVGEFLFRVLTDHTITLEITEKIFVEILTSFPTNISKRELGQMFLIFCLKLIELNSSKLLLTPENQLINKKVDKLLQITQIYSSSSKLWTPNYAQKPKAA